MLKRHQVFSALLCMTMMHPHIALANVEEEFKSLREQVKSLEQRQQKIESEKIAPVHVTQSSGSFNPDTSLILSGTYGSYRQEPDSKATGFDLLPNDHGYSRSFSLKESELAISANIDPMFSGDVRLALSADGSISVENATIQANELGHGLKLKMGRFYSSLGYLNDHHAHSWDFADQPLVYRTLWDNQTAEDGVQMKWLAPTDLFLEVGAEAGRGRGYPGSDYKNNNGVGAWTSYLHAGGDVGENHSWRAGLSFHQTSRINAEIEAFDVKNKYTGDSYTSGADFVWKYAPGRNNRIGNFTLQAEFFQRREQGHLTYDSSGTTPVTGLYNSNPSGWYVQGVYQFSPHWRIGLRHDQLNAGSPDIGSNLVNVTKPDGYLPRRDSLMFDYSASEFSRIRLQYADDRSRENLNDQQFFVQFIMSMGAHGAHAY